MPNLLHLDSSADLTQSRSRAITATFADAWRALGDDHTVTHRDLHTEPLPHLRTPAQHWPERLRGDAAPVPAALDELQATILAELLAADVVLIGAPMYNYSMPSTLKAWIDLIHVPGITAPFDVPTQPLAGRNAVIVTSRGAVYDAGTPTESWDHVVPPLQLVLGSALGMTVSVVATSRTLADSVAALAGEREAANTELAAAHAEAGSLARRLG